MKDSYLKTVKPRNVRRKLAEYGLTPDQFERMLTAQGEACAICEDSCAERLCVDHDHATGRVRGLLCKPCNAGLGRFRDSAELLTRAARYISDGPS